MSPPEKVAYNVQQFAEASGMSTDQVYALIKSKQLGARKVGVRWIIPAAAAEAFLRGEGHAQLADGYVADPPAPATASRFTDQAPRAPAPDATAGALVNVDVLRALIREVVEEVLAERLDVGDATGAEIRLYTSDEVIEILGISRATFWHYTRKYPHEFRTFLSGKRRVMRRTDLEDWIQFRKEEDRG